MFPFSFSFLQRMKEKENIDLEPLMAAFKKFSIGLGFLKPLTHSMPPTLMHTFPCARTHTHTHSSLQSCLLSFSLSHTHTCTHTRTLFCRKSCERISPNEKCTIFMPCCFFAGFQIGRVRECQNNGFIVGWLKCQSMLPSLDIPERIVERL